MYTDFSAGTPSLLHFFATMFRQLLVKMLKINTSIFFFFFILRRSSVVEPGVLVIVSMSSLSPAGSSILMSF